MTKIAQILVNGLSRGTVAELAADALFSYVAGAYAYVRPGDTITTDDGHSYEVAASDATDHDLITAGGVKLYVLPGAQGYDLAAFAAPTDGVTPADAAVAKWWNKVFSTQTSGYVPDGDYLITAMIETTTDATRLRIKGQSKSGVRFIASAANTTGVLSVKPSTKLHRIQFENLSFTAAVGAEGTALNVEIAPGGLQIGRTVEFRNIEVRPLAGDGSGNGQGKFTTGIRCIGAWYPLFENCFVVGPWDGANLDSGDGANVPIQMGTCFDVTGSYSPAFMNCHGQSAGDGIMSAAAYAGTDTDQETLRVFSTTLQTMRCITAERNTKEPMVQINGGHIHGYEYGLKLRGWAYVSIQGVLFFNSNSTASPSSDIYLDNCNGVTILNNTFGLGVDATATRTNIDITNGSTGVLVSGNVFGGGALNGVRKDGTCNGVIVDETNWFYKTIPGTPLTAVVNNIAGTGINDLSSGVTVSATEIISTKRHDKIAVSRTERRDAGAVDQVLDRTISAGRDSSNATSLIYAQMQHVIGSATSGAHSGRTEFYNTVAGSILLDMSIGGGVALAALTRQGHGTLNAQTFYAANLEGASGSFTTTDGKTVTVTGGIITGIA